MKAIARGWRGLPWAQALLVALAVGQAGCSCFVPELELEPQDVGCPIGTPCPDGSCVLGIVPNWEGICCGFGGECEPCPFGGFECPDGTCATTPENCCAHGGSCDPGDDGPHRQPGSTGGDTDAFASSEEGSSSEGSSEGTSSDTDDASTTTGGDAASSGSTE